MANDVMAYRAAIGLFYNRIQGYSKSYVFRSFPLKSIISQALFIIKHVTHFAINLLMSVVCLLTIIHTCLVFKTLVTQFLHVLCYHTFNYTTDIGDVLKADLISIDILNLNYLLYYFNSNYIIR